MSQYQIILKRTDELSDTDWTQYTAAFNKVFDKQFTEVHFKNKYLGTSLDYSYHGVLMHMSQIVGMFTAMPRKYMYGEKEITIGLGCDAFILKEHRRDEFFLKDMAAIVTTAFENEGVIFFISIPNKAAYPYWKYYGGWKDIGKLDYYIVPLRVSKLLKKYRFLDVFSFSFFKTIISFFTFINFFSNISVKKKIHLKHDEEYFPQRYSSEYIIGKNNNDTSFVYRIYNEDNIRTAYLIDCFPLSPRNIAQSINKIIKESKDEIDVVIFIGKIDNPPFFFIKVPEKKEPRVQPFIGLSINDSVQEDFFLIESWEVSLANFDNR